MAKKNLKYITYAYALGAILVVVGHSYPTVNYNIVPPYMDAFRTYLYTIHMPLFFLIAGFLLKFTKPNQRYKYSKFIKAKSLKFFVPYVVFTAVAFIPKLLLKGFVNDNVQLSFESVIKVFFSPRDNIWGHFWFIPTLFILYALSYLLLKASENRPAKIITTILLLVLCIFPINTDWLAIHDLCMQAIWFWVGIILCNFISTNVHKFSKWYFILALAFLSIAVYSIPVNNVLHTVCVTISTFSMLMAILLLSNVISKKGSKLLDLLTGKTYAIYLLSWPVQSIADIIFNQLLHVGYYISSPLMLICGLAIPLLIIFVYRKIKPINCKFFNLCLGLE